MSATQTTPKLALVAEGETVSCPMCGTLNSSEEIFCTNAECHKALGEFRYVREELQTEKHWHEVLAERVTGFIGKPRFIVFHLLWFLVWVLVNSGLIVLVRQFDSYPFGLLGILVGIEAVLITGFILISENRQTAHADKRAEIDYEISVRTYREILAMRETMGTMATRLEQIEQRLDVPKEPESHE